MQHALPTRDHLLVSTHTLDDMLNPMLFRAPGGSRTITLCDSPEQVTRHAREIAGPDVRVVVVGGDGTIQAAAQGLYEADRPAHLAIVPAGTANDAARGLELGTPLEMLERLEQGTLQPRHFDLNLVNDRVSVNVVSLGTPAQVTRETPQGIKALFGGLAYVLHGLGTLADTQPFKVRMQADGLDFDGEALAVYVGNLPFAGGGFRVCPDADPTDGQLEVLIVPQMEVGPLLALFGDTALRDDPRLHELVELHRFSEIRISLPDETPINLDGEAYAARDLTIRTVPAALTLWA